MSDKKTRRDAPAVNAGAMADIAFLLLVFFLVTTTIAEDQGVLVRLPVWVEEELVETPLSDKNVLTVLVNASDELMVENQRSSVGKLPNLLREHVISPARTPQQAVVSLTHDRSTSYSTYLAVYDALKAGYQEMWNEVASRRFGATYHQLTQAQQFSVRQEIPMIISEAEPVDHGLALE
ncbi:biopolymer transporter ExbD [Neolewinella lacunae]|uniref:Biopolymer transporter ExbD n=1 Tax=Neolewinella lacunae TaxID=1517758 RepID=A0A923T698_9BACT|nr:biopolymer transporter ExbD [Neolewinella lacunae]MBC6993190.1 biopolymer transporter ExbD [Neolewinella lacunae]MDN3637109.1 biopolymer transporter ExbD [Neolewinella lacunae]